MRFPTFLVPTFLLAILAGCGAYPKTEAEAVVVREPAELTCPPRIADRVCYERSVSEPGGRVRREIICWCVVR